LTKVLNAGGITQHTLLFQEKKRLSETMGGSQPEAHNALAAVGPLLDIGAPKKASWGMDVETIASRHGEQIVSTEQYYTDARNDDDSREQHARSLLGGVRTPQVHRNVDEDESSLLNQAVSSLDENSLLNDVLMCSHNIDPTGNGQLSLEFVWQLVNTQKRAVDLSPENEVVFAGGRSKIGTRRYMKFVESFRSLYIMSNGEDRQVLAGLLVLVAQTRGYRFLKMDKATGKLVHVTDEFAKEQTMHILLPQAAKGKEKALIIPTSIAKYPRGQTKFSSEEDKIIVHAVMTSSERPFTAWARLAEKLPGYKSKQIRDRWINHLNPNINHQKFSSEEVSFQ